MNQEYKAPKSFALAIKPTLSLFKRRYTAKKLGINNMDDPSEWYAIAERIYNEFVEQGLTEADAQSYATSVVSSGQYAVFPPTPHELALSVREKKDLDIIKHQFPSCFAELFEWLELRYPSTWTLAGSKLNVLKQWHSYLAEFDKTDFSFDKATSLLRSSIDFQKYPPNNAQMERILLLASIDEDIPRASDAYHLATTTQDLESLPLILRYARRLFGSYALRMRSDNMVRREFCDFYDRVVDDYLRGKVTREDMVEKPSENEKEKKDREPVVEGKKAASLISGM